MKRDFAFWVILVLSVLSLPALFTAISLASELSTVQSQAIERGHAVWCVDKSFAWVDEGCD